MKIDRPNFSVFLEYLSIKGGELDKAIKHGQSGAKTRKQESEKNVSKKIEKEKIPNWFYDDLRILFGPDLIEKIQKPNIISASQYLINQIPNTRINKIYLHSNSKHPRINLNDSIRGIFTKNGDIIWCSSDDFVHAELIIIGMLYNKIPRQQEYSNYNWSQSFSSCNDFLAFEYYKPGKRTGLSISYDPTTIKQIVSALKRETGIFKMYKSLFMKHLNVDVNDLKPTGMVYTKKHTEYK